MNEQKQEQLQKVLQEHPELNDKLKAITADSQAEAQEKTIELLKEYGVVLTAEDFKMPEGKLSDDELAAVAGGGGCGGRCAGGYSLCLLHRVHSQQEAGRKGRDSAPGVP